MEPPHWLASRQRGRIQQPCGAMAKQAKRTGTDAANTRQLEGGFKIVQPQRFYPITAGILYMGGNKTCFVQFQAGQATEG